MDVEIHKHSHDEILASWGPVLIRVLNGGATTYEDIDVACELFDTLLERYPAIACLAVLEQGTPTPNAEVRRYNLERFGPYTPRMVLGMAFLGLGFWASASLAATAVVLRVLGRQNAIVETELDKLADKIALELVGLDARALVAVIEDLRAQLLAERRAG